jgi:hypothetical protein
VCTGAPVQYEQTVRPCPQPSSCVSPEHAPVPSSSAAWPTDRGLHASTFPAHLKHFLGDTLDLSRFQ